MIKIKEYLSENKEAKTKDIAEYIGLKHSRTREILSQMDSAESIGTNTNRKYRLKDNQKIELSLKDEIKCNIYEKSSQIDSLL
mgnify:CR=1 FL=1